MAVAVLVAPLALTGDDLELFAVNALALGYGTFTVGSYMAIRVR